MGITLSWFKKDGETQQAAPPVSENVGEPPNTLGILRFAVLVGLLALMIVSILLHSIDSFNNQNVATHIGGMFLGLGLLLTMWISLRSSANAEKRRVGDGVSVSGAGGFRNYMINRRGFIILLFFFGLGMATWYMGTRHKRPLSERYTILVPSVVLCLVIWLRFWNGRDGQNGENAREIPLIIFMLNLFGIVYAFTAFIDNHTTTNVLWFILLGCLLSVLFVQTMWDWRKSKKSVAGIVKTDEEKAAAAVENMKTCVDELLGLVIDEGGDSQADAKTELLTKQLEHLQKCWGEDDAVWTGDAAPTTLYNAAEQLAAKVKTLESDGDVQENTVKIEQFKRVIAQWKQE
jgi:hypothetical protein